MKTVASPVNMVCGASLSAKLARLHACLQRCAHRKTGLDEYFGQSYKHGVCLQHLQRPASMKTVASLESRVCRASAPSKEAPPRQRLYCEGSFPDAPARTVTPRAGAGDVVARFPEPLLEDESANRVPSGSARPYHGTWCLDRSLEACT